jgi:hypothetical protein
VAPKKELLAHRETLLLLEHVFCRCHHPYRVLQAARK